MANEIPSEETIKKVAKVDVDDIRYIYACGVNPKDKDLIKVSLTDSRVLYCDKLDFETDQN